MDFVSKLQCQWVSFNVKYSVRFHFGWGNEFKKILDATCLIVGSTTSGLVINRMDR